MPKLIATLLCWLPSRRRDAQKQQTATPQPPRQPENRPATEGHTQLPSLTHEQKLAAGVTRLNLAIRFARAARTAPDIYGDRFKQAHHMLQSVAGILATDATTALQWSAADSLVKALDEDNGTASRQAMETLKRLSAQWPHINGGERTYRQIAETCSEAMRLVPLRKLGATGAEVESLLREAQQLRMNNEYGAALACLTRAKKAAAGPVFSWHLALQKEIERTSLQLLEKVREPQSREFVKEYGERYDRTQPYRPPLTTPL